MSQKYKRNIKLKYDLQSVKMKNTAIVFWYGIAKTFYFQETQKSFATVCQKCIGPTLKELQTFSSSLAKYIAKFQEKLCGS